MRETNGDGGTVCLIAGRDKGLESWERMADGPNWRIAMFGRRAAMSAGDCEGVGFV
jgi:hypothetical protein